MKLYLSDASIFLLAFIITLALLRQRQQPRPNNAKPQTPPETAKDDPFLIIERSA